MMLRKREPQFAHASSSPLWELVGLLRCYLCSESADQYPAQIPLVLPLSSPSVSLHARQLLSSQALTASADLSLNTLSHFLRSDLAIQEPRKKSSNAKPERCECYAACRYCKRRHGGEVSERGSGGRCTRAPVNEEEFWKRREWRIFGQSEYG